MRVVSALLCQGEKNIDFIEVGSILKSEEMLDMRSRKYSTARIIITLLLFIVLTITLVFNGLAGPGSPPFSHSTGNVSDVYFTCITPAGYTFIIWGIIYFCLVLIALYAVALLVLKVEGDPVYELGGAVSIQFMCTLIINFLFNIGWLFAWDDFNPTASFILLLFVAITNVLALVIAAYGFSDRAEILFEKSKRLFWANILVINGLAIYVVWTIIATLLNFTIFLSYGENLVLNNVCVGVLSFLLVACIVWFIVENTLLIRGANPLLAQYLVLVWSITGVYVEQLNEETASNEVLALEVTILSVGVLMTIFRILILTYRNRDNGIYSRI
ncbi:hypothetical protein Pcinc_021298 [Petrolisthes cinctipes]|uniref:Uncharacterized protein n=1 Tax=Petrolisthes cinctipes TaxID=88211 RepID=A0AAE1FHV7_PETCI|nr:hypothetical protein Pcinc_021298 [Petrolisthes cinctipes]